VATAARSAGVAYIDLAVGDTKALIDGITQIVRQAADAAQVELSRGLDVSGHLGSFQGIADAAADAAGAAGASISDALTEAAQDAATGVSDSIVEAVTEAATTASESLKTTLAEAGREAGEQLALNFEDATRDIQLGLFGEEDVARASEEA